MRYRNSITFAGVNPTIQLFGVSHLLIIAAIPAIAGLLVWWTRKDRSVSRSLRLGLATFLLINELVWYSYCLVRGWVSFPYGLPLNLCDIVVWLTIVAAFTLKPVFVELAYYWGIAGTTMAVITPDLGVPLASYPGAYFFFAHDGVVITLLVLVWGRITRPATGSVWRALIWLNVYTILVGCFNAVFQTNYFYLCEKPSNPSLLDYMGSWPVYLLVCEVIAVGVFYLLWIPFQEKNRHILR
jgi:hypothetical integral membrane protein (TIGR02206 family)